MSTVQKVELVAAVVGEYSLASTLAVLELPKSTWYYHRRQKVDYEAKYAHLQPVLEEIARQHPEYGYRRTTTELHETYQEQVNHKVVQRLHQLWGLALLRRTRAPKPSAIRQIIVAAGDRVNLLAQLKEIGPLDVLHTDFTELRFAGGTQKAYLMPIIGHASKVAFGWAVGESANRALALAAWKQARVMMNELDIEPTGIVMHHDQDPVYTSYDWTGRLLLRDQLQLSYTLDGARGNTEMEAFISRFKNENRSLLLDAPTIEVLNQVVNERMRYYNQVRRHSALQNQPPRQFLDRWLIAVEEDRLSSELSSRITLKPEK
jgi:transposase InsO family protein